MEKKLSRKEPKKRICCQCGALVPEKQEQCLICATPFSQKECLPSPPKLEKTTPTPTKVIESDRRFPRLVAFIFVIILIFGSISVGFLEYLSLTQLKKTYTSKNALLYHQKPSTLKIQLETQKEPTLLRQDFNEIIGKEQKTLYSKDSYDNRFVAYLNNQFPYKDRVGGDLVLLDLTTLSEKAQIHEGITLASQVIDFEFFPSSNKIAYVTQEGGLFVGDYGKTAGLFPSDAISLHQLDSKVGAIVGISGEHILYIKGENIHPSTLLTNREIVSTGDPNRSPAPFDLYVFSTAILENSPQLVAAGAINILDTYKDYDRIIYTKLFQPQPLAKYNVFLYTEQGEEVQLASQVSFVINANAQLGQLLYLTPNQSKLLYSDLIYDDLATQDIYLPNPATKERPIFPTPDEIKEKDGLNKAYEEKKQRDLFRQTVKNMITEYQKESYLSYSLNYLRDPTSPPEIVSENIIGLQPISNLISVDKDEKLALFNSPDLSKVFRKTLSDFTPQDVEDFLAQPLSITSMLSETLPESLILYSMELGTTQVLHTEQGEGTISQYAIAPNQSAVFFISAPNGESKVGTLYTWKIGPHTQDGTLYVDDMVSNIVGFTSEISPGVVYETASRDTPPEYNLYYLDAGGIQEVDTDVSTGSLVQSVGDKETHLLYFKDYSPSSKSGVLMELVNQDQKVISLQLHQYLYLGGNQFYLVEGGAYPPYSLYRMGEDKVLLDADVLNYQVLDADFFPE